MYIACCDRLTHKSQGLHIKNDRHQVWVTWRVIDIDTYYMYKSINTNADDVWWSKTMLVLRRKIQHFSITFLRRFFDSASEERVCSRPSPEPSAEWVMISARAEIGHPLEDESLSYRQNERLENKLNIMWRMVRTRAEARGVHKKKRENVTCYTALVARVRVLVLGVYGGELIACNLKTDDQQSWWVL